MSADVEAFRSRVGNCYELSARYVTDHWGVLGIRLVHGTIQRGDLPPNPHAWVTFTLGADVVVVDPVLGPSPMPLDIYTEWANAVPLVEYTEREAATWQLAAGHYGPWQ